MRTGLAAALAALLFAVPAEARMERAYIGTFTNTGGGRQGLFGNRAEGIYLTEIDSETGRMTTPRLVAKTPSPTWLLADPARGVLYACNYYHGFADPKEPRGAGAVSAFRIGADGGLTLINQVSVGDAPAQVAMAPGGSWLVAGSYDFGSAAVLPVAADGSLGAYTDLIRPQGPAGPDAAADSPPGNLATSGHEHSRMHGVVFDPSGKYVILDDAGLDRVSVFTLDETAGKVNKVMDYPQTPGSAPRHSIFGGGGRVLYTIFEQNANITVSDFDPATGAIRLRQTVSMLPPGFAGSVKGAEILLSKDGRDLYASGRFHDVIAHFRVGGDGGLTYAGEVPAGTNFIRGLAQDPSGNLLLAMGQYGDNIVAFRREARTGTPLPLGLYAPVPSPVAMEFADPAP